MRRAAQRFAWRVWRGETGAVGAATRALLLPLSGLWRAVTWWRNRTHDRRGGVSVDGLTVVSVGNLAVGGTGKTPFASWVVGVLVDRGARPTLLLRGYGRDEALLHRVWTPGVPVEVGADRVESARRARKAGANMAVLDDGFQHRRLARRLDIVLLSADDAFPGPVLPRGPYREPPEALRRADVVVMTRRGVSVDTAERHAQEVVAGGFVRDGVAFAGLRFVADGVAPLGTVHGSPFPSGLAGSGALVLTAIARPETFRRDVEALTGQPAELLAFSDHHDFTDGDARAARRRAGERPIIVTEKDAVKLVDHADELGETWVVRQRLAWDWGEDVVRERLQALVPAPSGRRS